MQLRGVSARAAAAALLLAFAAHAASARAEVRLLGLEAASDGGGTRIELRADGATPASEPFRLAAPSRLVLDLPGVVNASGRQRLDVGGRDVLRVRIGQHAGFLRIVLDLAGESVAAPRIEHGPRSLSLAFGEARLPAVAAEPPVPAAAPTEPVPAARAAPEPSSAESEFIRIYGIELQAGAEQDRVLVFAERALEAELVTLDAGTVELRLAGAVLEPSAARRVKPDVGGAVSEVLAFRPLSKGAPEVRIQIERSAGVEPTLSRRGAILAVEFPLPDGARNAGITLAFVDTELAEVVREVAKATGASFLFDDRLRGGVTISVVERVTPREAVEILHAALLSKGFAAVPSPGGAWRILPTGETGTAAPLSDRALDPGARRTRDDAGAAAPCRGPGPGHEPRPARGRTIVAAPFGPTNSVILAGSERQLQRYVALVQALDDAEAEELAVVVLRHRDAAEIAGILGEAGRSWARRPGRGARPSRSGTTNAATAC